LPPIFLCIKICPLSTDPYPAFYIQGGRITRKSLSRLLYDLDMDEYIGDPLGTGSIIPSKEGYQELIKGYVIPSGLVTSGLTHLLGRRSIC
jgi:hypothetical protein